MDNSLLAVRLGLLAPETPPTPQLAQLNPKSAKAAYLQNQRTDHAAPTVSEFAALLKNDSRFDAWHAGTVRRSPHSQGSFRIEDLAQWALAQAKLRSAENVVADLIEFTNSNSVKMTEVLVLWGLRPAKAIDLGNDLSLVPLESLAPSQPWDRFFGIRNVLLPEDDGFTAPRPRAALVHEFLHQPVRIPVGFNAPDRSVAQLMRTIALLLPLITYSPVCDIAHWFQCDLQTPLIGGVQSWAGPTIEQAFYAENETRECDAADAFTIINRFLQCPENVRQFFHVPLSRLNDARRAIDHTRKAIDLGISLESLLTTDKDQSNDSISYRLRQRAAALINCDGPAKKLIYDRVKTLYDLRSRAVHGSQLKQHIIFQGYRVSTTDFLRDSADMITVLLRFMLMLDKPPDWDGLIMGW